MWLCLCAICVAVSGYLWMSVCCLLSSTADIRRKVSRALSLCILSKIDIEQINDHHATNANSRHSIQSQQQPTTNHWRYLNSKQCNNNYFVRNASDLSNATTYQPTVNSVIVEANDEDESMTNLLNYLNQNHLDDLLETDIISSSQNSNSDIH
ncbi:unnamed protein product [Didymodactylos carnosus]|uniref:Uncharacterized protein n=1 Tax=Didymodactylos carnosus TaxID=1234261 RepID=A0A8S2TR34_9BILA|nr:unnamed protein product [Didymodactylos carnosus]CAF4276025.1 unnamed protein product [Didymodactylos carnosus]